MAKGGGTIGYHYLLTLLGLGPRATIDELVEIEVGGEKAWSGSASGTDIITINKPDLFGGNKREGGIQGALQLLSGANDQVLPGASAPIAVGTVGPVLSTVIPDIKALIGQPMGELRGNWGFIFDGLVASLSPYPKEWKFRLRSALTGWHGGVAWYPEKAIINLEGDGSYAPEAGSAASGATTSAAGLLTGLVFQEIFDREAPKIAPVRTIKAMNPAHIVYRVMTDPQWGAGKDPADLDENSFIAAANQLCSELFGMCLLWSRQEDVERFLQVVMDHVAGAVYLDPRTGKWTFRLARGDYVIDDLPLYTFQTGLLDIENDDNASGVESFNEIRVTGHDPVTNQPFEVAAQSLAALQDPDAEIISESRDYKGLPTRGLALRVAERDLRPYAIGPKRFKLKFDQRAWAVSRMMPIRIQAPERGIADIVLRVADITVGAPDDPTITVLAAEDTFTFAQTAFGTVVPGSTAREPTIAFPSPRIQLVEAPYRDIYLRIGESEASALPDTSSFISQYALQPTAAALDFDLASKVDIEPAYRYTPQQPFVVWGDLVAAIGPTDTAVTLGNNFGINADLVGEALLIGGADGEIVRCDAVVGSVITIARGCGDTVPRPHAAGSSVWAFDDTHGHDAREYALGETVATLVLPRTRNQLLDEADAVPESIILEARHALPYPPGNVSVDGDSIYAPNGYHPEPVIAFVDRDRIVQADQLVSFGEAGVGPEPGTTYRMRVYDPSDPVTPLRTAAVVSPWTYTAAMQLTDGAGASVVMRLDSQRDGLDSWQYHEFTVPLAVATFDSTLTTFDSTTRTWDEN